jgi:hypothetical protein
MRRLYAWLAGLAGGAAVYRAFKRRPQPATDRAERVADPAAALKEKLAEARAAGDDRDAFEAGETPVDEAAEPPPADGVEGRRRSVHDRGRAAIDEMKSD